MSSVQSESEKTVKLTTTIYQIESSVTGVTNLVTLPGRAAHSHTATSLFLLPVGEQ